MIYFIQIILQQIYYFCYLIYKKLLINMNQDDKIKPKIKMIGHSRPIVTNEIPSSNSQLNQQTNQYPERCKAKIFIKNSQIVSNQQFQQPTQQDSNANTNSLIQGQDQQIQNQNTLVPEHKIQLLEREVYKACNDDPYQEFQRKCMVKGHREASIMEICLNKKCKAASRFICEFCQKYDLHKSDRGQKPHNTMKQFEVNQIIKENYNSLVKFYNDYSNQIDQQIGALKQQIDALYFQLNVLASSVQMNEIQCRIRQLRDILDERLKLCEIDENSLYSLIINQPEKYVYKEFCDINNQFNQLLSIIDQLNEKSKAIPTLVSSLTQVTVIEQQELNTDQTISKAKQLIKLSEFEQAIAILIDQIEDDKNKDREGDLRHTLGYTYYKKKQYDLALTQFEKSMVLCKKELHYLFHYYMGMCKLKSFHTFMNDLSEDQKGSQCVFIIQPFQDAINQNSSFGKAYIQISKIYQILDNKEDQFKIIEQGIQFDKNNQKLLLALAQIHYNAQQFKDALKYIDLALKIKEFDLNSLYEKNEKLMLEEKKFNPILSKGVYFLTNLGIILYELGQYQDSLSLMRLLVTYNDSNYKIDLTIAKCFTQIEKFEQALQILQKLQQERKNDTDIENQIFKILKNPKYHKQK
ncbi:hypothetical protein pb186bvf_012859 [Paramecium bursaria]